MNAKRRQGLGLVLILVGLIVGGAEFPASYVWAPLLALVPLLWGARLVVNAEREIRATAERRCPWAV